MGASQSMLSRLENEVLGNEAGLKALDGALRRSTDALLRRKVRWSQKIGQLVKVYSTI